MVRVKLEKNFIINDKIVCKNSEVIINESYFEGSEKFKSPHVINDNIVKAGFFKIEEAKEKSIELNTMKGDIIGIGVDNNGNKIIKIKPINKPGFSIQTNQNIPTAHRKTSKDIWNATEEELADIEKEIKDYIKNYGTDKQKVIL